MTSIMGALLPTLQVERLREGLTDYLATTFALTDPDAQGALSDFIGDPVSGMFKGAYVRLRLPFAPARGNWGMHLDWLPDGFVPYQHQAQAFERLSTKFRGRPLPTLVTTGTGSGKTESFLYPILDHVLRAKKAGVAGMKALIIYPMNALANDQELRLARIIAKDSRLAGVTAGLYTGEQSSGGRTIVSAEGLISDRRLMHDSPPDILLTNYKMLDHLLLRPDRAAMWRQSAESLQYVVLDEFHTYDGAQGTDVAMLLRRLGLAVKSYWTGESAVTDEDRSRPMGKITPVATSATLGSKESPTAMLDFAHTVFGEVFDEAAAIGETRLTVQQWLDDRSSALDGLWRQNRPTAFEEIVEWLDSFARTAPSNATLTAGVLATMFKRVNDPGDGLRRVIADLRMLDSVEQLDLLKSHATIIKLLERSINATSIADLAEELLPAPEPDTPNARTARQRYLSYVLAALSHLRTELGRDALNVDVHLWIRELSRIDRALSATTEYHWGDDGPVDNRSKEFEAAVFCRHCGRSGWGVRLAPTGSALDSADESVRAYHASGGNRFRALISAPAEAQIGQDVEGLRWLRIEDREISDETPDPESIEVLEGRTLPVLALVGPEADANSQKDVCPACGSADGIRFLGSAVATQLSVALSNLFGDAELDTVEKKALMFTDSVQDAAHRAGFVQARSHTLSLRSTLRNALSNTVSGGEMMTLTELCERVVDRAGEDATRRYHLLAPDIVEHVAFTAFWQPNPPGPDRRKALRNVKRRLQFDIDLEFGLQSRLGRTLELTGSVVAEVDLGDADRIVRVGEAAVAATQHQMSTGDTESGSDPAAITRWVRGTAERMRTQGAIRHEWLDRFVAKDANRRWIWGGRPKGQGMPAFPKGRPAPAFPAIGSRTVPEGFDAITAPSSWYARWASQCLDVSPFEGGFLARTLFAVLAEQRILSAVSTERDLTAYQLSEDAILVGVPEFDDLIESRHLLVCDVCQTPNPGTIAVVDQLDGAPCLLVRCPGTLRRGPRKQNFYRRLYDSSEMKRVVAREHTSLLPTEIRLEYETKFKSTTADPTAPNVLVATPTLEMGIDIGDLSTVMLGSMPRSVSSYLQRVGRAGRLTGNSLVLAFVRGRGEHLPKLHDPTSVIQGDVRPPATFLTAEEILQRQYVAHIVDLVARAPGAQDPGNARAVLGSFDEGTWMAALIDIADQHADNLVDGFLAQFGELLDTGARDALRSWATPTAGGAPGPMVANLREAVHRWNRDVAELTSRRTAVDTIIPELEKRANSPAATDDDHRDLRTARGTLRLLGNHIRELTTEHWVGVLERYGVLPNYTLLDDSVTLDVGITWIDPDTNQYTGDTATYRRGSRVALTELAPGSTFYAQGLAVEIDAIDLGPGESSIHTWRLCPQCGWASIVPASDETPPPIQCPRCHTGAIADISQRLQVVEMSKVSAEVRRDEASIGDSRDERRRETFTVLTAADIDPDNIASRWFVTDRDFGAEYLRSMDIRWLNMGRRTSQGSKRTIAGEETTSGLFRVCSGCGRLDRIAGQNHAHEHRAWCKYRTATDEKHVREIALARTLRTQAVLLHLPTWLEFDVFAYPSLSAAILLGLRQVIGGSPEHLDVATITDALHAPNQHALLIHDTVPGGTGYLAEFADAAKVWSVLVAARERCRNCECAQQDRRACHQCLLPFAPPHALDKVSRKAALNVLDTLLDAKGDTEPDWDTWQQSMTREEPGKKVGSEESPLERDFYVAFLDRLRAMGATIKEKPGTYAPSATITVPGKKIRTWTLFPQPQMGNVVPDFELSTLDANIPDIAIFADGRKFHAVQDNNRVADDAHKRAMLRSGHVIVWSFGYEDLQRFKRNEAVKPPWFLEQAAKVTMQLGKLKPEVFRRFTTADPLTQLLEFINDPDDTVWREVGRWLPLMFVRSEQFKGDDTAIAAWALDILDGKSTSIAPGTYACWSYSDGPLTVTAAMRPDTGDIAAVLALDDRERKLEAHGGRAWKEWVRLSNWFGLSETNTVTTRSLLAADSSTPDRSGVTTGAHLAPEWQRVLDETVSAAEKELVLALAKAGTPAPVMGLEADNGEVVDLGWPDGQVGVLIYDNAETAGIMSDLGWTICPPDVEQIVAVLKSNGVM
ncbi:DEAD/DEAH box helicase [Nocardia sp. NPDC088792]|uniref:DEAD/DEAH box helicase n=1 Tax=Nocardia sp. NPDC088792 TaxID=3364332 RepID=UPI00381863CE